MRLMHGKISPFVRKVMVAAIEKGLDAKIEPVPTTVAAAKPNHDLLRLNPIGKIPTLVLDDGTAIYDSLVICDYFDHVQPTPRLIPVDHPDRLRAMRLNAIADGLLLAGVLAKGEASRPHERQWPEYMSAQWTKVMTCVGALDREMTDVGRSPTIGDIAVGCALGWLEFRAPEENWKERLPGLARWFATFSERESMQRTKPQS